MHILGLTLLASLAALSSGCVGTAGEPKLASGEVNIENPEDTGNGDGPQVPEIEAFSCTPDQGTAPLTTTCSWSIWDPNSLPLHCSLDIGSDGTIETEIDDCQTVTDKELVVNSTGENPIRLTVFDPAGNRTSREVTITPVQKPNQNPVIGSITANPVQGETPLKTTVSFSASDPDGDALTCKITFKDPQSLLDLELLAPNPCGGANLRAVTVQPVGTQTLTLEVTDSKGGVATQTLNVKVLGPSVGDLSISKIEWGQTVISTNPQLVAGKDALLRIHVVSVKAGVSGVKVRATAKRGSTVLGDVVLTGPSSPPTAPMPSNLSQQWRGTVPGSWIASGLSIQVQIDPSNELNETNEQNNEQTLTPRIGTEVVLPMTFVPVVQGGRTGTPLDIAQSMRQKWPIKDIHVKTRAAYTFSTALGAEGDGWDTLLSQLNQVRQSDGSSRYYVGWVNMASSTGVRGVGYVGKGVALAADNELIPVIHELGHNLGCYHAPCNNPATVDPDYPVTTGRLDVQGYDYVSGQLVDASSNYDLMSYCRPVWTSEYHYKLVQFWLDTHPVVSTTAAFKTTSSNPHMVVSGIIYDNQIIINPITVQDGLDLSEVTPPGPFQLTLHGAKPHTVSFDTTPLGEGEGKHFSVVVPQMPGMSAVSVSHRNKMLGARMAGPIAKGLQTATTQLKRANGGFELTWNSSAYPYASVAHLGDEGRTTLSLWLQGGTAWVSTLGLESGGQIEISLGDGIQNTKVMFSN